MNLTPILLPGNMCDARLWQGDGDALSRVLGRFGRGVAHHADLSRDDNIASMAARTLSEVDGKLLLLGFSMGAIVAVDMWCQASARIAGLVLLGYNATADLPDRAAHRPNQQAEVRAGGLERVLVEELKPKYLGARHRCDARLLELLREMGMALGPEVFVRQSEALRTRTDRRAALAAMDLPVLFGCGVEDGLCPPAWHRDWASRVGDAELITVAGAGHMLPLEEPQTLAAEIDGWLNLKEFG